VSSATNDSAKAMFAASAPPAASAPLDPDPAIAHLPLSSVGPA
jgi:hypothetical protein